MKRKSFVFQMALLVLCTGALIVACRPPGGPPLTNASLRIHIGNNIAAKTIAPPSDATTVVSYLVSGNGPNGSSFAPQKVTGDSVTVDGLAFGIWTVKVDALNANLDTIGHGESSATVEAGDNSVTVSVLLAAGLGNLSLTVTWNTSQVQGPGSVSASITPVNGGSPQPLSFPPGIDGSLTSNTSGIAPGYYILNLSLRDHIGNVVGSTTDLVWIVNAQTSTGKFDFTNAVNTGSIKISITPLPNPLNVSISQSGSTVSAVVANYSGADLTYQWYMNGVAVGTNSSNYTLPTMPGCYWVSVIVWTTNWAQAGSATANYQVGKPIINVAGYWDLYFIVQGQSEMGPVVTYIKQTGTNLEGNTNVNLYVTGTIEGRNLSLSGSTSGITITMTGAASESSDLISGDVNAGAMGQGTFRMVPSTRNTGSVKMSGNLNGMPANLDTVYMLAGAPSKTYSFGFGLNPNGVWGWIGFSTRNLLVGHYTVGKLDQPNSMEVGASQNSSSSQASGGTVDIESCDSAEIKGSFNLIFDGNSVSGTFDMPSNGAGTVTIQQGSIWFGQRLDSAYTGVITGSVGVNTRFDINFIDKMVSGYLNFTVNGDWSARSYTLPAEAWFSISWRPNPPTGPWFEGPLNNLSGGITITRYDSSRITGSFDTVFSEGSAKGSFDVAL